MSGRERPGPPARTAGAALLLALLLVPRAGGAQATQEGDAVADLRSLLAPGFLVEDRNRDGHVDFVRARLVVPAGAGATEVAAAANLAARLGFESYAADHGLLVPDGPGTPWGAAPVVVVGAAAGALAAAGVDLEAESADLAPGEGAIARLRPSAALPGGGVWVSGGDATGLLAAAAVLAGRYPAVWAPDGAEYAELAEGLATFLDDGNVPAAGLTLDRAVVSASRPGVARLRATLRLDTAPDVEAARRLLAPDGTGSDAGEEGQPGAEPDAAGDPSPIGEPPDTAAVERPDPASVLVPGLHRLDVHIVGPDGATEIHRVRPDRPWREADLRAWQPRSVPDFTLSDLYTIRGLFQDTSQDLVPDRSDVYLSLHGAAGAAAAIDVAQRIGLETAGLAFPVARVAGEDDRPDEAGFPILFGVGHYGTERLREEGKLDVATWTAGEGFVELVPEAFGERHALVIGGADASGLDAAAALVARRLPHLHANRKGELHLADLETEVRRFFQARSLAGRAALAMVKLGAWADRIAAGERPGIPATAGEAGGDSPPLRGIEVELALDTVPDGLDAHVRALLADRLPGVDATVALHPTGFGAGRPVFDEAVELPWEVDEVWRILRDEGFPGLAGAGAGRIEVRVSEPPEVRRALEAGIGDTLRARGLDADAIQVTVLNAYKQGFSWIEDGLLPEMRTLAPARIEITYRHLQDSDEVPWSVMESETRWLQELFPIDAVLARELGIADSLVVFRAEPAPRASDDPRPDPSSVDAAHPIYRIRALDASGAPLLEEDFSPRYVIRPYFDLHPEYERIRVTTGWVSVEADGRAVVDRRVRTDMEAFWDFWQETILPRVRDYVMDLHEGAVSPATAPFFDELRIDVRLSEPNHRIGIDEEVISSLESLHNDLYFTTLAFLGHLGEHYGVGALAFPGRILPMIDPSGDGRAGAARVSLAGRARAAPELRLRATTDDGAGRWRYPLTPLPTDVPKLRGIALRAGEPELARLLFDVVARDSVDRRDEHRGRAAEGAVDRAFLSVQMLEGMVGAVGELHAAGVLGPALSFEGVGELAFRFGVEDEDDFRRLAALPRSPSPTPTRNPVLAAPGFEHRGERLVQWDTPIAPAENDSILARIASFPEAEVYFVGRSYLGQNTFAVDLLPPIEAQVRSQAKLNALRPTALFSGRQHANEVSSTSHLLRLAELLATDPAHRELLQRVNVVVHPITNADGARLAVEMQEVNPDFTLHAGYLGALGVDVTAGAGSDDPIYPEAKVRPALMRTWLPDIFINMHGYPSHEWVQHFSGYAAWVRGRTVTQRTWWAPRGWFIPGFSWVDDPEHPEIRDAQFAILDTIARAITGEPAVQAMSERQYARYAKYGRQDVENFREHFHEGMLVYLALRGRDATGPGPSNPRINTFSATTEAPDETARGDWLELVATAGLAHSSALVRYLATGEARVEREAEAFEGVVTRKVFRKRPVLPPDEDPDPEGDADPGTGGR